MVLKLSTFFDYLLLKLNSVCAKIGFLKGCCGSASNTNVSQELISMVWICVVDGDVVAQANAVDARINIS